MKKMFVLVMVMAMMTIVSNALAGGIDTKEIEVNEIEVNPIVINEIQVKPITMNEIEIKEDILEGTILGETTLFEDVTTLYEDATTLYEDAIKEDVIQEDVITEDIIHEDVIKEDIIHEDVIKEDTIQKDAISKKVPYYIIAIGGDKFIDITVNQHPAWIEAIGNGFNAGVNWVSDTAVEFGDWCVDSFNWAKDGICGLFTK